MSKHPPGNRPFEDFAQDAESTRLLRDLLVRTLMYLLPSLIESDEMLARESQRLAEELKGAYSTQHIRMLTQQIKDFYFSINRQVAGNAEKQAIFMRSLNVLMDNFKDTLPPVSPLRKEIGEFQQLILAPTQQSRIDRAIKHLREMVFRHKKS